MEHYFFYLCDRFNMLLTTVILNISHEIYSQIKIFFDFCGFNLRQGNIQQVAKQQYFSCKKM
jgi:hypothetical protein